MSKTIIEAKNLTKQYMKQKAVDDVSFAIKEGMICGLIGPNGAGKTTIMKMLGGLVLPTEGSLSLFGGSTEEELAKARSRMSFMIETPYAKEKMTARQNLEKQRLQKGIPNKERIDEVLEIVWLTDTGKKPVQKFSLGMRQRLGIANALLTKPEIMGLDEPVNGLDPEGIVEIRELLLKLGIRRLTLLQLFLSMDSGLHKFLIFLLHLVCLGAQSILLLQHGAKLLLRPLGFILSGLKLFPVFLSQFFQKIQYILFVKTADGGITKLIFHLGTSHPAPESRFCHGCAFPTYFNTVG